MKSVQLTLCTYYTSNGAYMSMGSLYGASGYEADGGLCAVRATYIHGGLKMFLELIIIMFVRRF